MKFNLQTMSALRNLFFSLTIGQRVTLRSIVESRPIDPGNRFVDSLVELGLVTSPENGLIATEAGRYCRKVILRRAALVDGVAWSQCVQIFASLTVPERIGLKSVLKGVPESVSRECLARLQAIGLVAYDGHTWQLTENGRAIAHFC
jgi:hypothetical protein